VGEQPQPERELCTPDIVDLPIINLEDAGRPFKIKVSTIRMTIARALEHFIEYIRVEFLEWHIGLLKRRMEKMEIENEAQDLTAAEARSTCEECEEYDHVQGKPQINASSSIQDLVPLCTQLKDFMDEQAKLNEDAVTKFEAMEKVLENLDGKVMEVRNSLREVSIMMKMLETQVGQLVGHPMGNKGEFLRQSQGREKEKGTQTHSGEMKDHTKETTKITTEGPEFEMPSHYMKEVVASVKTKGQSQPVKTKKMTKPKNKPSPKMVQKWVPKIATPVKSVDPK
jgi:desulfoferrodoxin (superoxide reductase-like protein)